MWDFLLRMNVVDGPFIITVYALAAAVFIYLLGRGPWWGWIVTVIVVLVVGAIVGAGVLFVGGQRARPVRRSGERGHLVVGARGVRGVRPRHLEPLELALVAQAHRPSRDPVVRAHRAPRHQRGVRPRPYARNSILGISTAGTDLPRRARRHPSPDPAEPLYQTWTPPAHMPSVGTIGTPSPAVPNTNSDFPARPAQLYLPPAALVNHPPRLPLVIMMMGQPGDPDASFIGQVLDEYAARNGGLAPSCSSSTSLATPPAEDPALPRHRDGPRADLHHAGRGAGGRSSISTCCRDASSRRSPGTRTVVSARRTSARSTPRCSAASVVSPVEYAGAEQNDEVLGT